MKQAKQPCWGCLKVQVPIGKPYCNPCQGRMWDGIPFEGLLKEPLNAGEEHPTARQPGRFSLSGYQVKSSFSLVESLTDKSVKVEFKTDAGRYILKEPLGERDFLRPEDSCANEHLSMQLASQVMGLKVAETALAQFAMGEWGYVCKRYDYAPDGTKLGRESGTSLLQHVPSQPQDTNYRKLGSYVELGLAIGKYSALGPADVLRFFRQVVFNYLIWNDDAHTGNFELLTNSEGQLSLSPAYDLLNTHLHLTGGEYFGLADGLYPDWEHGPTMNTEGSPGTPEFHEFGRRLGLSNRVIEAEWKRLLNPRTLEKALIMIDASYLSDESKAIYHKDFERRWRLLERTWKAS